VVVESNHCSELLKADTRRPWPLKQRISGRHGHLSNEAARELLAEVACPHWRRVYLTHVSQDCNSRAAVELAFLQVRASLTACEFSVVCHGETTPFYDFV
jgi:phosphoribosyl 1,2-cyclic phosphodiesterase